MLSTNENVKKIADLIEAVKSYVGLQGEYLKPDKLLTLHS